MRARGMVRAVARRGRTIIEVLHGEAPLGLFPGLAPADGWAQIWLVGSAGGPLGGDDLELSVEVGSGAALAVGSVAASVVLSGDAPSRLVVRAAVAPGGALVWSPQPLVVTAGADHVVENTVDAACDAHVWWRDELVLGRAGEHPGRCTVRQRADLGGRAWVRNDLDIGGPGWDGGAVTGGHRAIGSVLASSRPASTTPRTHDRGVAADLLLEAGGALTVALAPDRLTLDALLPAPDFPVLQRSHHAASRLDA